MFPWWRCPVNSASILANKTEIEIESVHFCTSSIWLICGSLLSLLISYKVISLLLQVVQGE